MDIHWYVLQFLKPVAAIGFGLCLPRCIIPLKKGLKSDNQKLINKGIAYLIISLFSAWLFIYLFKVS